MRKIIFTPILFAFISCSGQEQIEIKEPETVSHTSTPVDIYYADHLNDSLPSQSIGKVSNGKLAAGTLIPFSGKNFVYFDSSSYLNGRAFANNKVIESIVASYKNLAKLYPHRTFYVMELSNEQGGKIFPHRTHQNGLSVDFMMPLVKGGEIYAKEDSTGIAHYLMDFDDEGRLSEDPSVQIDFDVVAKHILELDKAARINGLKINKVIINTNLKDELFATVQGKILKATGIYVVRNLEPLINDLHDDHYHIDFEFL